MSSRAQWRSLPARLGSGYRVVALDLHGYGENPLPANEESFLLEDEVQLVARHAAEALGGSQPMHVVGHSYGAAVALHLARTRPDLVSSLALYEPVCCNVLPAGGAYHDVVRQFGERVAARVARGDLSGATRIFIDYWSSPGAYEGLREDQRERLERVVRKVPIEFAALFAAPRDARWYGGITVPTLLMSGDASPESMREVMRRLWAAIPGSRLVQMRGNHMLPIAEPAAVDGEIARFLESLAYPAALRRAGGIA